MKYALLLLPVFLFAACQKKGQYLQNTNTDCKKALYANSLYKDLPIWEPSWMISEQNPESVSGKDSMEAIIKEGRSYLKNDGKSYLLLVANNKRQYVEGDSIHIVAVFDTDCKLMCYAKVRPFKYLDNGNWTKQKQSIEVLPNEGTVSAPFEGNELTYYSYIPWRP